jgi:hypothetical protein
LRWGEKAAEILIGIIKGSESNEDRGVRYKIDYTRIDLLYFDISVNV